MEERGGSLARRIPAAALAVACLISSRAFCAEEETGALAATTANAPSQTLVVEEAKPAEGIAPTASQQHLELDAWTARAVHTGDVLERVPGVDVVRYGAIGQGSFVSIRGSTPAQVLVVVDGVRMNPVAGGGADLDSVPLELLESVDVVRGAGAERYGADALGGVVVFRTRPQRAGVAGSVTGGSEGNARAALSAATRAGAWLVDASVRHEQAPETFRYRDDYRGEFRDRENASASAFGAAAGVRGPTAGGELALRLWGTTLDAGAPGLSEQPTTEATRGEDRLTGVLRWDGRGNPADAAVWSFEASSRFEQQEYDDPIGYLGGDPVHSESAGTAYAGGASVRRLLGGGRLLLGAGVEARDERIADPDLGAHVRDVGAARASASVFLAGGMLELDAAMRVESATGAGDAGGAIPLPSAGAAVRGGWWTLRAHAGRSFRLPTFSELYLPESETAGGNPDLKPEDAWSGDVGVSACVGDARSFGASVEVTAFETLLDQAIVFAPVGPHRYEPVNTGRSWLYGVESAGVLLLPWSTELRGSWTRTESHREATGEPLPQRPRDHVTARAATRPVAGPLELFAEGTWAWGAYADFFGNLAVPAGGVLGGGATLSLSRGRLAGLAITAEATNVTDADVRDALFFPQPGRAWWITLRWRGAVQETP